MADSPDRAATLPDQGSPDQGSPTAGLPDPGDAAPRSDQRRNVVLRELIDEMMASIRAASRRDLWTAEERAQYEDELAMIMTRVRKEAVHTPEEQA